MKEHQLMLDIIVEVLEIFPQEVKVFKYLRVNEMSDGKCDIEVQKRIYCIDAAHAKCKALIFKNRFLSLKNKLSLFTTYVTTVGLYGLATFYLTNDHKVDLEAAHFNCTRYDTLLIL